MAGAALLVLAVVNAVTTHQELRVSVYVHLPLGDPDRAVLYVLRVALVIRFLVNRVDAGNLVVLLPVAEVHDGGVDCDGLPHVVDLQEPVVVEEVYLEAALGGSHKIEERYLK